MFTCAWCKKEDISVYTRSEYKEPICSDCEYKYAFQQKMFTGKVSDLSKEQRREISAYLNNISRFVGAIRSVEREELVGNFKAALYCFGWVLFIIAILLLSIFSDWFEYANGILVWAVGGGYVVFSSIVYPRVRWLLKFYQLCNKAEKLGISL